MKITEAQARSWKHNLNLSNIPRKIKEKIFEGSEYSDRAQRLHEIDKELREVALGQNFYGIGLKQAIQIAHNGAKQHKYIDAAYGVSIFLEILERIIKDGQEAAYELSELPTKEFEVSDPDALEHFMQKEQVKQAGIKDIYRSFFGDPLEKAYAKQIGMHRRVIDGLVNHANSALNDVLLAFHRMGYANAKNDFLAWVREFENIKKIKARLNEKFVSTYKQSIKFFVDMAAKGLNTGAKQSVEQVAKKLQIQPEPEAIKPEAIKPEAPVVVENKAPESKDDGLEEFRKFVEEEKAKPQQSVPAPAEKTYEDLTPRQTKDVEQIGTLINKLKSDNPAEIVETLDELSKENGPIVDTSGNEVAEVNNGEISFPNVLDEENKPVTMNVWSLPKVPEETLNKLVEPQVPEQKPEIVEKVEQAVPEVAEKRKKGRPPGAKNKSTTTSTPSVEPKVEPTKQTIPEPIVSKPEANVIQAPGDYSEEKLAQLRPHERGTLVHNLKDQNILELLSKYKDALVRQSVAANDNTSQDTLFNLAKDEDEGVAKMAITSINDPSILGELAKSRNPNIRFFVLKNKNTPDEIKINLANDPEVKKRDNKEKADRFRLGLKPEVVKDLENRLPFVEPEAIEEPKAEVPVEEPKEEKSEGSFLDALSPKELKRWAENPKIPDETLLEIVNKANNDFFTQLAAIKNIKNPEVLAKITDKDLKSSVEMRLKELGSTLKPTEETPVEKTEAPVPVNEPVVEEKIEGLPQIPARTKDEKAQVDNSLVFVVLPDDFTAAGGKAQVQNLAKDYYKKEFPKVQSFIAEKERLLKDLFAKHPEYIDRAIVMIPYDEFVAKVEKKTQSGKKTLRHAEFYNNLVKLAGQDNPYLIATAMIEYSGEIEGTDPELSINLLTKAAKILNVL